MINSLVGNFLLLVLCMGPLVAQKRTLSLVVESSRGRTLAARCVDGLVYAASEDPDLASVPLGKGQRAFGIARGKLAVAREHGELIVINLETASEVEVAEGFAVVRAAWSSDGETLAAILQRDGAFHAILFGETRGTVQFPRPQPVLPDVLRWSADGRTLTYAERSIDGETTLVRWSEGENRRIPVGQTIPSDLLDDMRAGQGFATGATAKAGPVVNAPPVNDQPAGAIPISTLPFTYSQDISQATATGVETQTCLYQQGAVWFKFTASVSEYIEIDTVGSNFFVQLSAYQGATPSGTALRCTVSYEGFGATKLILTVTQGQTYWILAGNQSLSPPFLTIRFKPGSNRPPTIADVSFSSNSIGGQFSVNAADRNGASDVRFTQLLVNSTLSSVGGCYVHFDLYGRAAYLMNRGGDGWLGPLADSDSAAIGNGICTISHLSIYPYSETVSASIVMQFSDVKDGVQTIYARVVDSAGNDTQWQNSSLVRLDTLPEPPALSRPANWGTGGTFGLQLNDLYGPSHIAWAQFIFTSDFTSSQACYVHYDRAGGALYLVTDNGMNWTGPLTIGSGQTLANGQCTVQSSGQPTSGSTWLNLPLVVRFRDPAFRGVKQVLSRVVTVTNRERTWTNTNQTYEVTGVPRIASTLEARPGEPDWYTLAVTVAHPDGYTSVPWMQVILTPDLSSAASCYLHFDRAGSQVWLMADNGYTWLPARNFGSGPPLTNSRCSVDVARINVRFQGNSASIWLPVTFLPSNFPSNSTRLARTVDSVGRDTGWSNNDFLPLYY